MIKNHAISRSKKATPLKSEFGAISREAEMEMLFALGWSNQQVWKVIEMKYPEVIEDDKEREKVAGKRIPFDKDSRDRLGRQLRSVKGILKKEHEEKDDIISFAGKGDVFDLDEIRYDNVDRIMTGVKGMDYVWGTTRFVYDKVGHEKYGQYTGKEGHGAPRGGVTILAGAEGVGKSRSCIHLCAQLVKDTEERKGYNVLYCYGESRVEQFKQWARNVKGEGRFKVSTQVQLQDILATIRGENTKLGNFKPDIVFIDSMNMILEAKTHKGILRVLAAMKTIAIQNDIHIVLISHLNKQGELKGSRDIPYLVDIVMHATPIEGRRGFFEIRCPKKNRFGATPRAAMFQHLPDGEGVACIGNDTEIGTGSSYSLIRPKDPEVAEKKK
jgi:KaiC/GvpD/RAD55 family RecA-like ATPase